MTNRTLGTWRVVLGNQFNNTRIDCVLASGEYAGKTTSIGTIYNAADARLVAAAPDLLTACISGQRSLADLMNSIIEKGGGGDGGDAYQLYLAAQAANEQMVDAIEAVIMLDEIIPTAV